jgi:hypothetical protein
MNIHHDIVQQLRARLSDWDGMEAFLHLPPLQSADIYAGAPSIKIDVFYHDKIFSSKDRHSFFPDASFWETQHSKDRFFFQGNSVHILYRSVVEWERKWAGLEAPKDTEDSYGLYRLHRGNIIWSRTEWITGQKDRLQEMPRIFWENLIERILLRLEHIVTDLGLAAMSINPASFIYAQGRFVEGVVESLFCINRKFLSSPEEWEIHMTYFSCKPEGFSGYWDTFLRDEGIDRVKKWEIAKKLVADIWALGST